MKAHEGFVTQNIIRNNPMTSKPTQFKLIYTSLKVGCSTR